MLGVPRGGGPLTMGRPRTRTLAEGSLTLSGVPAFDRWATPLVPGPHDSRIQEGRLIGAGGGALEEAFPELRRGPRGCIESLIGDRDHALVHRIKSPGRNAGGAVEYGYVVTEASPPRELLGFFVSGHSREPATRILEAAASILGGPPDGPLSEWGGVYSASPPPSPDDVWARLTSGGLG